MTPDYTGHFLLKDLYDTAIITSLFTSSRIFFVTFFSVFLDVIFPYNPLTLYCFDRIDEWSTLVGIYDVTVGLVLQDHFSSV